jgi:hypothetical protein
VLTSPSVPRCPKTSRLVAAAWDAAAGPSRTSSRSCPGVRGRHRAAGEGTSVSDLDGSWFAGATKRLVWEGHGNADDFDELRIEPEVVFERAADEGTFRRQMLLTGTATAARERV